MSFGHRRYTAPMAQPLSLPRLLWNGLEGLERAHEHHGADGRRMSTLEEWANLLRVLDDQGVAVAQLPTQPAGLAALERHGYLRSDPGPTRAERTIRLTAWGCSVRDAYSELVEAVEVEWRRAFGDGLVEDLRRVLERLSDRVADG